MLSELSHTQYAISILYIKASPSTGMNHSARHDSNKLPSLPMMTTLAEDHSMLMKLIRLTYLLAG